MLGVQVELFIVDRVVPGMTAESLGEAQRCLREAARRVSAGGEPVRFVRCTFVPEQQRCLDLFEAHSAADVRRVNDVAQVPFRSVAPAAEYTMPDAAPTGGDTRDRSGATGRNRL